MDLSDDLHCGTSQDFGGHYTSGNLIEISLILILLKFLRCPVILFVQSFLLQLLSTVHDVIRSNVYISDNCTEISVRRV